MVSGFANDRQASALPSINDHQPPPSDVHDPSSASHNHPAGLLSRTLDRARKVLSPGHRRPREPHRSPVSLPSATEATPMNLRQPHNTIPSPDAETAYPDGGTTRPLGTQPPSSIPATSEPPPTPQVPSFSPLSSDTRSHGQRPPSKPSRQHRGRARVADILVDLPTAPGSRTTRARFAPTKSPARPPTLATTARPPPALVMPRTTQGTWRPTTPHAPCK